MIIVTISLLWLTTADDRRKTSPEPFQTIAIDCVTGWHADYDSKTCVRNP